MSERARGRSRPLAKCRPAGKLARAMLSEIYSSFTEGFDTADLRDAKSFDEELSV